MFATIPSFGQFRAPEYEKRGHEISLPACRQVIFVSTYTIKDVGADFVREIDGSFLADT
jgi:hypothetical protein